MFVVLGWGHCLPLRRPQSTASECRSMPRTELLEEVRRSRQVLASLTKENKEEVELAEQEADLMLLFAEHMEREEERKKEDMFQLERVKVGQS